MTVTEELPVRIDPEFQALIPPLSDDEFAALELSIMTEGCRDAIVVWQHDGDDIIVDGHNRYAICTAAGLPYKTVTRDFSSRSEVMLWMIRNQLARRNLTDGMRLKLAWQLKEKIADIAEESHKANGGDKVSAMARAASANWQTPLDKVETAEELGKIAESSTRNVYRYKYVRDTAPTELLERLHTGELTISGAERMARELAKHPQPVIDLSLRVAGDSIDKIHILERLYKSNGKDGSNATFDEIATNGGFHYGDEMDDWCDFAESTVGQIRAALASVAKYHQVIEAGVKSGGVPPALQSSESNEWYTPQVYMDAVHAVMGGIDIDPASNPEANQIVRADKYYTLETNGFDKSWHGRVFLNPPYGRDAELSISNQAKWTARLIEQYSNGIVSEAVLLVNAVTDRTWFRPLWDYSLCFTNHRIPFYRPGGEPGAQPVMGSVFVYFGNRRDVFADVFKQFGPVVMSTVRES